MGGPTVRQIKDFIYHLPHNVPTVAFWISRDQHHFRTGIQKLLESLVISGLSPGKWPKRSLGKAWKNIHSMLYFCVHIARSFFKGTQSPPWIEKFLICELTYVWDPCKRPWIPTMATQVRFLFMRPRIFSPIYVKQHPRKLSIYFISRDPRDPGLTYAGENILITVLSLLLIVLVAPTLLWKLNNTTWPLKSLSSHWDQKTQ